MTYPNPSHGAKAFALTEPASAILFTVFSLASGTDNDFIHDIWIVGAFWALLAAFTHVQWRRFRH